MYPYFDTNVLKKEGARTLNMIADVYDNMEDLKVMPDIKPGYIRSKITDAPPIKGEDMETILRDTEQFIIPSMTHWQHPKFFGYYPSSVSHHTVLAEIIAVAFNNPGFTWVCSPANTEVENAMMDWCVKMLGLPEYFLLKNTGGGIIANTVGDALFLSVNAAKHKKMAELNLEAYSPDILKFVGYFSEHSHSQNLKALMLKDIPYKRAIPVKMCPKAQNFMMDVEKFKEILEEDLKNGLIPFWFGATIGTTSTCATDPMAEIVEICQKHGIWVSVDAAYAGSSFVCPEYQEQYGKGLEGVDSICVNFSKKLLCGMTTALFYVKDKVAYTASLAGKSASLYLNPTYLKNEYSEDLDVVDYKDWQVGLGRRFSGLKLWFVIRGLGVEGLQVFIKKGVKMAMIFENHLKTDKRFEMICKRELGLVCFRAIRDHNDNEIEPEKLNEFNKKLIEKVKETGEFLIVGSEVNGIFFLRFATGNTTTEEKHVEQFWTHVVKSIADLSL